MIQSFEVLVVPKATPDRQDSWGNPDGASARTASSKADLTTHTLMPLENKDVAVIIGALVGVVLGTMAVFTVAITLFTLFPWHSVLVGAAALVLWCVWSWWHIITDNKRNR